MDNQNLDSNLVPNLTLIYTENAKVAATFWEWRHKLMERYFVVIGGLIAGEAWLYHESKLSMALSVPLFLASGYSLISFMMDRVNYKILRGCYEVGKEIEARLTDIPGSYTGLFNKYTRVNYSALLRVLYLGSSILFLISGIIVYMNRG